MDDSYLASKVALDVPYTTYPELLRKRALEMPQKAAFIFVDKELRRSIVTFGDLLENSLNFAKSLVHHGVKKGDIVGLSGRNVPEWLIANFGIQLAGGCPLYFSFRQKDGNDIVTLFRSIGNVKMLIFDPGAEEQNCAIVSSIVEKMSTCDEMNATSANKLERIIAFYKNAHSQFNQSIFDVYAKDVEVDLPRLDPEDLGAIFLSSGSMGISKAVPHSHHAILIMSHNYSLSLLPESEDGILYNDRKFSWNAGYPMWELYRGGTRVVATDALRSSSLSALAEVVSEIVEIEKVTYAVLVQPVIDQLMRKKLPIKLKKIIIVGVVGFRSVLDSVGNICDELVNIYGMTEFGGLAMGSYCEDDVRKYKQKVLSVKPFPGVELKVTDENGYVVPVGQRGKIHARSQKRFTGYLNHKTQWIAGLLKTGWLNSEDGGFVTEDGTLVIEGRISELLQVYGVKIYPFEIENAIKGMKEISSVVIIPVREKETQHCVPCAAVIYHPGSEVTPKDIQDHIKEEFIVTKENPIMAPLYVPQVVVEFKTFPQTSSGKPDRHAIAAAVNCQIDCKKYECIG